MERDKIFIQDLLEINGSSDLRLHLIAGEEGLNKEITIGDINRPGLSLAGFFDFFA